jgi:hypothetical protein
MKEIFFTVKRDQVVIGEYCSKEIYSLAAKGFLKPDDLIQKKNGKWFFLNQIKNINFPDKTGEESAFLEKINPSEMITHGGKKTKRITKATIILLLTTSVVVATIFVIIKSNKSYFEMGKDGIPTSEKIEKDILINKDGDLNIVNNVGGIFGDIVGKINVAKNEIGKMNEDKVNEKEKLKLENLANQQVIKEDLKNNFPVIPKQIIDINQELIRRGFKNQNESNYVHKGHIIDFLRFGNSDAKKLYKTNKVKAIEAGLELQNTVGNFNFNLSGKGVVGYLPKDGEHYLRLQLPFCVLGQDFSEKNCLKGIIESGWVEEFNKNRPACLYDNGKVRVFDWFTWGGGFTGSGMGLEKKFINESERSGGYIYYAEDVSTLVFRIKPVGVPKEKEAEYFNFLHKNLTYRVVFGNLQAIPFDSAVYFSKKSLAEFNCDCYKIRSSNLSGLNLSSNNPDLIEVKIDNQKSDRPDLYIRPSADVLAVGLYVNGKEIGVYKK